MSEINESKEVKNSIFISDSDVFDISIKYYFDNKKLYVEDIDIDFNKEHASQELKMSFKYPSQGDYSTISEFSMLKSMNGDNTDSDIRNFMNLEVARVVVLARKWDLTEKLNAESLMKLNTKIYKAIIVAIRKEIGNEGLI